MCLEWESKYCWLDRELIESDIRAHPNVWFYSSYCPIEQQPSLIEGDTSFEEMRWDAYLGITSNTVPQHVRQVPFIGSELCFLTPKLALGHF